MPRLRQLDIIRGLAILMVLIWHYLPRDGSVTPFLVIPTNLFWSGVDLFFVLSGFLIGGVLLENVDKINYYQVFYGRRAARILPLYVALYLVFYLIQKLHVIDLAQARAWSGLPTWSYFTLTQNFVMAQYKEFGGEWFSVTWSLAVEEQFYIFLSLLIRNVRKTGLTIVTVGLILSAPLIRMLLPYLSAYVLPFARSDSLMLGVLLALIWQNQAGRDFLRQNAGYFRWAFAFLLVGVGILTYRNTRVGDPLGHFLLALFYADLIVLALISTSSFAARIFNNRILEWFGLRSYGIYLIHLPLLLLLGLALPYLSLSGLSAWIVNMVALVLLLGITELSFRFFEKPLIGLGHHFKYRPAATPITDAA